MKSAFSTSRIAIALCSLTMIFTGCQSETAEPGPDSNQPGPAVTDQGDEDSGDEDSGDVASGDDEDPEADTTFVTMTFSSADDITVTADLYMVYGKSSPFIVLCHQAGWSRGEYREIAPRLNQLGFNCMAIDQRSGGGVNDIVNETFAAATEAGRETNFVDAEQDMIAAVEFARDNYAEGKILLWGSSYSAALTLRIAGEQPQLLDGALAFAPGEYFERFEKPADWITTSAALIITPVFITSARDEAGEWESIFDAIPGDMKTSFIPETDGNHGSRALWEQFDDHEAYWETASMFLEQFVD